MSLRSSELKEDDEKRELENAISKISHEAWNVTESVKRVILQHTPVYKDWLEGKNDWGVEEIEKFQTGALVKIIGSVVKVMQEENGLNQFEKNELAVDLKTYCDNISFHECLEANWIGRIFRTMCTIYKIQMSKVKSKPVSSGVAAAILKKFLLEVTKNTPKIYAKVKMEIFEADKENLLLNSVRNVTEISAMQNVFYNSKPFLETEMALLFTSCWAKGIIPDEEFVRLKGLFGNSNSYVVNTMFSTEGVNQYKSLRLLSACIVAGLASVMVFLTELDNCKRIKFDQNFTVPQKAKAKKVVEAKEK